MLLIPKSLKNNTFSQKRKDAALYLKQALNLPKDTSLDQVLNLYFEERTRYLADEGHDNPHFRWGGNFC